MVRGGPGDAAGREPVRAPAEGIANTGAAQPNTAARRHASALTTATAPRETAVEAEEEMAEAVGV
ncbi:hypothetical protein KO481_21510 [Nocardia sp. NEAU-G5]|uniref:Uncharacterized protein n=1 Tax=Nocardia albiluteola TaxID=2842303 RepID=A0ABS6B1C2_9NOCA|nr:hypothetical protein [Nocardia albiluteola]MBU3064097.1 hypothetical protein [Nocardia albiluteola]